MSTRSFELIPFRKEDALSGFYIYGRVSRNINSISILYELAGSLSEIDIPEHSINPIRKFQLWEHTCFELFVGIKGNPQYWEFNLSPSGDWNVFHFLGYRNNDIHNRLIESNVFKILPFTTHKQPNRFLLNLECDLSSLINELDILDIGISAVIKFIDQSHPTYWALRHSDKIKPDFHNRMDFIFNI